MQTLTLNIHKLNKYYYNSQSTGRKELMKLFDFMLLTNYKVLLPILPILPYTNTRAHHFNDHFLGKHGLLLLV